MRVLGQAGRRRDRANRGSDLRGREQDHHGQARKEHHNPEGPLHREADHPRGPRPLALGEGDLK